MNAIDLLTKRQSHSQLQAPYPTEKHLELLFQAALKVPDHGGLTPWHFTIIKDQGLNKLSDIFLQAIEGSDADEFKIKKTANMPFRAPMIIVVSTRLKEHTKVPAQEQIIAAGCAAHAMQMAAFTLGYGAIWRTGELSYNELVKDKLNVDKENQIIGFLYIGTKSKEIPVKPKKDITDFISYL